MDRYIIKNLLREGLLDEDYAAQNELKILAEDVYKVVVETIVTNSRYVQSSTIVAPFIWDCFDDLKKNYDTLNDFNGNFKLQVDIRYDYGPRGSFGRINDKQGFLILKMNREKVQESLEKYVMPYLKGDEESTPEEIKEMEHTMFMALYDRELISTILHELQHAYDSWRSNDKFATSRRTDKYHAKYPPPADDSSGEQRKLSPEQYQEYLKLQHEINARFAQAIDNTTFYHYNFRKDPSLPMRHKTMKDLNSVLDDFKNKFHGFDIMTPNVKKRLINRLTKMYYETSENINKEEV